MLLCKVKISLVKKLLYQKNSITQRTCGNTVEEVKNTDNQLHKK